MNIRADDTAHLHLGQTGFSWGDSDRRGKYSWMCVDNYRKCVNRTVRPKVFLNLIQEKALSLN